MFYKDSLTPIKRKPPTETSNAVCASCKSSLHESSTTHNKSGAPSLFQNLVLSALTLQNESLEKEPKKLNFFAHKTSKWNCTTCLVSNVDSCDKFTFLLKLKPKLPTGKCCSILRNRNYLGGECREEKV